ncbi:molybdenum ABC transporter ATP-binding protein ModC [Vibrio rumoiensis]|uniref:Molybdenum ABC transporter ATP-binding protein n=1 Tax=Vibrio rumoiensis 1S-45 TaxID=1188252 RepID=A0A1E5DZF5_9VIBR|nr:molybdenum ABC transporter ATP-binding protein ModC [Vibrio rumoiensis]OEF23211.1 molybdenum ABC transporter ATP-binding protein [Vibrio rumoiensis 1S-45]
MIKLAFKQQLEQFMLDINVDIPQHGITAIFGRSGAGKTSIINAISGLNNPDSGKIIVGERALYDSNKNINIAIDKRKIGYVFQEARLFPHYKVKGNLLYGASRHYDRNHFDQIVQLLDLSTLLDRYPVDLSGGEKQRCAIARALLSEPEMLLMDEPLASLDLPRKQEVMPFLEKLSQEINIPILYVTHSLEEILHLADHMLLIEDGQIKASGDIETMWRSTAFQPWQKNSELSTLFKGMLTEHHPKYALSYVELARNIGVWMSGIQVKKGESLRVRIHASDVSITLSQAKDTSMRNIIPATIVELAKVTDPTQPVSLRLSLGSGLSLWANITAWAYDDLQLKTGQKVFAQIKGVRLTNKDMARKP